MSWLPKTSVIVPIDFSGTSVPALETARELVEGVSHLHAVHVVLPLDNMSPGMEWGAVDDESRVEAARQHFDGFLEERGWQGVTTVVRLGEPGHEITEYAKEAGADLIVIPSHGYGGFKRMLLGSVTEKVIRLAECEVLVLRRSDAE